MWPAALCSGLVALSCGWAEVWRNPPTLKKRFCGLSDLPTHQLFVGDTRILQGSPAHPHRIVSHPHLAKLHNLCHWSSQPLQGVVTYVAWWSIWDCDQVFWSAESVLDHLIVYFWGSWLLDFQGSKVKLQPCILDPLIFSSSEVTLMPWSAPKRPPDILILSHVQYLCQTTVWWCSSSRMALCLSRKLTNIQAHPGKLSTHR